MCWFKKKLLPLTVPYPEESLDLSKTIGNTSPATVIQSWLVKYGVPQSYWDFWKSRINIHLYDNVWPTELLVKYPTITQNSPAFAVDDGGRQLYVMAKALNVGVVDHEQVHTSWSLLTTVEQNEFSILFAQYKKSDPLIILLFKTNPYGLSSDIEGHADLHRYLNEKMPKPLQKYYPKLIGV